MKKNKKKNENIENNDITGLPQNILMVGERVMEEKNIYILQKVYARIHKFAVDKTENEHGGILVGRVCNELGKQNTIIEGFIEAKYNAATPTTLTFTHETWEYFHAEIEKRFKGMKIVGWIHTHPNFGIFLSDNDKFIHENFFTDNNQVAFVVDPIQHDEGFFYWIDGKLEQCPGFYVYDKVGKKIKQNPWVNDGDEEEDVIVKKGASPVWIAVLAVLLTFNIIFSVFQHDKIAALEKKIEDYDLVFKYGLIGIDVSEYADEIRLYMAEQEKLKEEAEKERLKEETEKAKAKEAGAEQNTTQPHSKGKAQDDVNQNPQPSAEQNK